MLEGSEASHKGLGESFGRRMARPQKDRYCRYGKEPQTCDAADPCRENRCRSQSGRFETPQNLGHERSDEHRPEKEDCSESHLPNLAVIQCSPQCLVFVIGDVLREVQKR
ncbi:hypothetical protein GCM10020255_011600 [Rhodococcus baikonurensis]